MNRHSRFITFFVIGLLCLSNFSEASGLNFDVRKKSPLTTKGDLYTFDTGGQRLAVGSNGQILSADASTATGLRWIAAPTGTVSNSGTLTSNAVIIGQGSSAVAAITADSSTTHALFSTATSPAFRNIVSSDIASGTFGPNVGGTGQSTYTKGDLLSSIGSANLTKLAVGSDGQVLSSDSSTSTGIAWRAPSPLTTKGDIFVFGGSPTRLAVGANGQILSSDSSTTSGLKWVNISSYDAGTVVTMTDAATIIPNLDLGKTFVVTLGATRILGAPINPTDGRSYRFIISQDSSGSRALTYSTAYRFGSDVTSPTLTTAAGNQDYLGIVCNVRGARISYDVVAIAKGYAPG